MAVRMGGQGQTKTIWEFQGIYKEMEAEGEMNDDDLKQYKVYRIENHAGFEGAKKYSIHIVTY